MNFSTIYKGLAIIFVCVASYSLFSIAKFDSFFYTGFMNNNEQQVGAAYTIEKINYLGMYAGTDITHSAGFVIYSLFDFWEIPRTEFAINDIQEFFVGQEAIGSGVARLNLFLESYGFSTEVIDITKIDRDLESKIEENLRNNIPLIVWQALTPDTDLKISTFRLMIGYGEDYYEFHDNEFGNNYRISKEEFSLLNSLNAVTPNIVIAKPLDPSRPREASNISNYLTYEDRDPLMDSPSMRKIIILMNEIDSLASLNITQDRITGPDILQKNLEILSEPDFEKLHPTARLLVLNQIAIDYVRHVNKPEEAIALIEGRSLPLFSEFNLNEQFGPWERRQSIDFQPVWYSAPYIILAEAYEKTGNLEKSLEIYTQALSIDPTNERIKRAIDQLGV